MLKNEIILDEKYLDDNRKFIFIAFGKDLISSLQFNATKRIEEQFLDFRENKRLLFA